MHQEYRSLEQPQLVPDCLFADRQGHGQGAVRHVARAAGGPELEHDLHDQVAGPGDATGRQQFGVLVEEAERAA